MAPHRVRALTIIVGSILGALCSSVRATVPFAPAGDGHDTIPAFVNGKGPYPFILDTGADGTALYQHFAKEKHLQAGKARDVDGQTGSVSSPSYSLRACSKTNSGVVA